jgi:hypothetical protein
LPNQKVLDEFKYLSFASISFGSNSTPSCHKNGVEGGLLVQDPLGVCNLPIKRKMTLRNILVKEGYYLGENFIFRMVCALLMCLYCYASCLHYKICIANSESSNISKNTVSFIYTSSLAFFIFLASCHLLVNVFDQKADALYKKIGKQMVLTNQFFLTRLCLVKWKFIFGKSHDTKYGFKHY